MKVQRIFKDCFLYNHEDCYWVEIDINDIDNIMKKHKYLHSFCNILSEIDVLDKGYKIDFIQNNKIYFLISKDLKYIKNFHFYYPYSHMWNGYIPFVGIFEREIHSLEELKFIPTSNHYCIYLMGAIVGDVVGSIFEINNIKTKNFDLLSPDSDYTDDSVMTIAVADAILNNLPIVETLQKYGRDFPNRGYGKFFQDWINSDNPQPYRSWGNGSAMRTAAVGFAYNTEVEVLENAKRIAEVTHNHPDAIAGAQAVSMCIYLAKIGKAKQEIKMYVEKKFGYSLNKTIDEIRPDFNFDVSCKGTVIPAIRAFLESSDFESAIRLAISIGGDSDTIASIVGGIAQAYYKDMPIEISNKIYTLLPKEFQDLLHKFHDKYNIYITNILD